jgi:hypothetical protein
VSTRHLPIRPNLDQLKHQARDLLAAIRRGDSEALSDLRTYHRRQLDPARARLADAQYVLARSYGVASWPRLVLACRMTDAICRDDLDTVGALLTRHPRLLHKDARGVRGNWGPPMSYAANLGRKRIIEFLRGLGAEDVQFAFERACLQGQIDTAKLLHSMGARPVRGSVMGPCETQNAEGLAFLLARGRDQRRARKYSGTCRAGAGDILPESGRQTSVSRGPGAARCRDAGCAYHGTAPRADPSAGSAFTPRSGAAFPDVRTRRDLPARAGVLCRPFARPARHATCRCHAAAPVCGLRRDGDRSLAAGARRSCRCEGRGGWRGFRRPYRAIRVRRHAAHSPAAQRRVRAPAARPRCGLECPCVAPKAPSFRRRRDDA